MAGRSNPSKPAAQTLLLRRNPAHAVTPHKNTCIVTMAKNKPNYSAKSARQPSRPTIVLENPSRPNTSARTVNALCSVGKPICTLSPTSAATITARIASAPSKNSTPRNAHCLKPNLHNSSFVTFTGNIYSKPANLNIPRRLNRSSILPRSIILKMSWASSSPSTSPSPSPPEKPPIFFALSLTSMSHIKLCSTMPRQLRSTATNLT